MNALISSERFAPDSAAAVPRSVQSSSETRMFRSAVLGAFGIPLSLSGVPTDCPAQGLPVYLHPDTVKA